MNIIHGDFVDNPCPKNAVLVFTDPPYNLNKKYQGTEDNIPYPQWVHTLLTWSTAPWTLLLGPPSTLRDWLHLVPKPSHILWWHRTFLLPRRGLSFYAPSITPVLVYRKEDAVWYGPTRPTREYHDVVDASSSMGDVTRLKALGIKMPKHPGVTGTPLPKKVIPLLTQEDDLVVDPMAGLGSILVAALRQNRRVWGCEIEEEYVLAGNTWLTKEKERMNR